MNAASYSKLGYVKVKFESSAATAVKPDVLIEIVSESIAVNFDHELIGSIAANRSFNQRSIPGQVGPFVGDIMFYAEPKTVGYFLKAVCGEDTHTTLEAGVSELSEFQPLTTIPTMTIDVKRAGKSYVNRFFGARISRVMLAKDGNKIMVTATVVAQKVFTNSRLTADKAAGTSMPMDQTSGLTTSDTIQVLDKDDPSTVLAEYTIAAIVSETEITSSSISASLETDDIVVIKADTVDDEDYDRDAEFIYAGGAEVLAAQGANAIQALSARADCDDYSITIENDYVARWGATGGDFVDRMPAAIHMKGVKVSGKFSEVHANPLWMDVVRSNEQVGLRLRLLGAVLDSNVAVEAEATVESDDTGTVTVSIDGTGIGEGGNDYAIIVTQGTTLTVTKTNKLISVALDATPANNAVATVASAIDSALGAIGSATSSGSGNVTTTDNPDKIHFSGGRDANERALLQVDVPNANLRPFTPNLGNDDILMDDIEFDGVRDMQDGRDIHVVLRNDVTAY